MYRVKKLVSCLFLFYLVESCTSIKTITSKQPIKDGEVLLSEGEIFALGFFSLGSSSNRYVGIWYNKVPVQTIVWVANRDNPITDASGVLSIDQTGNLVLLYRSDTIPLWSTNVFPRAIASSASAKLLDTGNLVLFQGTNMVTAWQSFDYPTNTMLPFMKLGVNRRTGLNRFLTSWKSRDNPGVGEYLYKMDLMGKPQVFFYKDSVPLWRSGPWDGSRWNGVPEMEADSIVNASYIENDDEVSIMYGLHNASIYSRQVINETGIVERLTWHEQDGRWVRLWSAPVDQCDNYGHCGAFGVCDQQSNAVGLECSCLPGFEPISVLDWYTRAKFEGCRRKGDGRVCDKGEGFVKVEHMKVPDTSSALVDNSLDLKACEELCLKNCSCTGYTSSNISERESGCVTWYENLTDIRMLPDGGQDLYIRVDATELAQYSKESKRNHRNKTVIILVLPIAALLLIIFFVGYWLLVKRRKGNREQSKLLNNMRTTSTWQKDTDESQENIDLPFIDLRSLIAATDNFSSANKLGEGGFGSVYKARLDNSEEVAIKRLSKNSGQGIEEFKNEVTLIAKLQHRNLVRLLGCCIQNDEKMLIYEYLPNSSLDSFIFDKEKGLMVDWMKRFEIILGIARGMVYLHRDSRLRIIHRDLKASNVLLDSDMNPKISDFGMARIFCRDEIEANTRRVVGTYGYMAPEYAMEGIFSTKSDVFSFGVLLLEIVSGSKNISYHQEKCVNLIGHVWDLWREGKALDIVDSSFKESYESHQVLRCIHVGLLCVQEFANDRPTMPKVASMLSSETTLPFPNQPAFIFKTMNGRPNLLPKENSVNELTLTIIEAR